MEVGQVHTGLGEMAFSEQVKQVSCFSVLHASSLALRQCSLSILSFGLQPLIGCSKKTAQFLWAGLGDWQLPLYHSKSLQNGDT